MIKAQAIRSAAALRRGFTLIEILAVMAIILILTWFLLPNIVDAYDMAEVRACSANMEQVYAGMVHYKAKYEGIPESSGVAFFAELMSRGAMTNTTSNARRLTCPAIETGSLAIRDLKPENWWMDLELIDGSWSSYAGRDLDRFPMRKFPGDGKEPLMADDNDGGMNHATTTNVLYSDGSVHTFELFKLREEGLVGAEEILVVGPDSPIDDLRKLSLD